MRYEIIRTDTADAQLRDLLFYIADDSGDVDIALVCAPNIFGKNSQHFWQNILGKREPEIVLFKLPFLSLILRILL